MGDLFDTGMDILSAFSSSRQAAREREAQRAREMEEKRILDFFSPWLASLHQYEQEENGSLSRAVKWFRAHSAVPGASKATVEMMLVLDLVQMIRSIVLMEDEIRKSDAELLHTLSYYVTDDVVMSVDEAFEMIEESRYDEGDVKWLVPALLRDRKDPDLPRVIQIYQELGNKIGSFPDSAQAARTFGLIQVMRELEEFLTDEKASGSTDSCDAGQEAGSDPHAILKVTAGCSGPELRQAYLREISLWHPDKVSHLAPGLRIHAEQQTVAINEAYQTLKATQLE